MDEIPFGSAVVKEVSVPGSRATGTPSVLVRVIRSRSWYRADAETLRGEPVALGAGRYGHASVDGALAFAAQRLQDKFPLADVRPILDAAMESALFPEADPDFLSACDDPTVVRST